MPCPRRRAPGRAQSELDRISKRKTKHKLRVVRITTDDGQKLVGIKLPPRHARALIAQMKTRCEAKKLRDAQELEVAAQRALAKAREEKEAKAAADAPYQHHEKRGYSWPVAAVGITRPPLWRSVVERTDPLFAPRLQTVLVLKSSPNTHRGNAWVSVAQYPLLRTRCS